MDNIGIRIICTLIVHVTTCGYGMYRNLFHGYAWRSIHSMESEMIYVVTLNDTVNHEASGYDKGGILGVFSTPEMAEENIQKVIDCPYFQGNRTDFHIVSCELNTRYLWTNV